MKIFSFSIGFVICSLLACSQQTGERTFSLSDDYTKIERMITMRDGVRLFTAIYIPKDASVHNTYPILMERTPYGCKPYGELTLPNKLGPNPTLMREKYIFVRQDVRGRYKSEGVFEEMTPHKAIKKTNKDTDESTDAYDTIEWLLHNIKETNGNVGLHGISYPGFYAAAALPDAHPAIKAVSPQAPIMDEFMGDDVRHNGALFLLDNFDFMNYFNGQLVDSGKTYIPIISSFREDAYKYFLQMGSIKHSNSKDRFDGRAKNWNEYYLHDTYDDYWKVRNLRPHLKKIKPAVLIVGGWFDAEDMAGSLNAYETIEKQNPQNNSYLIMGPWTHGAWSHDLWDQFGTYQFGENVNNYYRQIETDFFNYYLKHKGKETFKEATIFNTGENKWVQFDEWPYIGVSPVALYFHANGIIKTIHTSDGTSDSYISDPGNPVPYVDGVHSERRNEYMVDDQQFASKRKDVLSYETDILESDMTVAGKINVELSVSLQTVDRNKNKLLDADFIVKIIDVSPELKDSILSAGFQKMVRADVFRGKFRNSFENPQGFWPGKTESIKFKLNDIFHTFKKGHRLMVQVQSSWFPLVERNPQKFMKTAEAAEKDFQPLRVTLYHDKSKISLPVIPSCRHALSDEQ